ncbi:MAG: site-specific DNA-methyltransferase [Atribacterota bacterium]
MGKVNLTEENLRILSECINNQTEIPEDLLMKLSPGFFEKLRQSGKFDYKELDKYKVPTIEYAGKRPESVILAQAAITGGAAPLQIVRSFANGNNNDWKNLIVQGDNLQFLKTCYMNIDPLIKDKVKDRVKLIYIDPPFGTGDEYGGNEGELSYRAKLMGSEYVESLRERLIYLRSLLRNDGVIYLRIDHHFGHYIKIVMDEIFKKNNFLNEIIVNRIKKSDSGAKKFNTATDSLYLYAKTEKYKESFNPYYKKLRKEKQDRWHAMDSQGQGGPAIILGKKIYPPKGRHWTFGQDTIFDLEKQGRIKLSKSGKPQYLIDSTSEILVDSNWTDIPGYSTVTGYPTENSEQLLERVISSFSIEGDIILDVFAGSGTTATVAEKLDRRWIMCDFGKHAIYTMQKRLLNIAGSKYLGNGTKDNKKYGKQPRTFSIISAGAYDFSRIMNLRKNKDIYISFVLGLFSIMRDDTDYSRKYKLSNIYAEKNGHPVEVFPVWEDEYLKNVRIDEDYLKDIISASGGKLNGDYYIVTPETCTVISDMTLKNSNKENVNFKLLKFPYKVLEDVSRQFQIEEQLASQDDINRLISSAGFYLNEEVKISTERVKGGFKITKFETGILNKNKERFKDLNGLSMILIDNDYDGKIFDMDLAIYAKEIGEDGMVKVENLTNKSYLIAIDKHGNESKVLKIG